MGGQRLQRIVSLVGITWLSLAGVDPAYRPATSRPYVQQAHAESPAPRGQASSEQMMRRSASAGPSGRILRGPTLDGWSPENGPDGAQQGELQNESYPLVALVDSYRAPLYPNPGARHAIGWAHVGTLLPAAETDESGSGCRDGRWYRTAGGAYFCTQDGFDLHDGLPALPDPDPRPDASQPTPFQYVRVTNPDAVRLEQRPDAEEAVAIDRAMTRGERYQSDNVERRLGGIYFLAVVGKETIGGVPFYRTVRGMYVRAADAELRATPPMHGERLDGSASLPFAFVIDDTQLHCHEDGTIDACGVAEKHARFAVDRVIESDGKRWVLGPDGIALPEDAVRVARPTERPADVPEGSKWVHIDLAQQTLVAYEGDRPVYVTLVSSGRDGYRTPTGLFRVQRKYLSKIMRGKDDVDGYYEIQEVPWTMYYDGNYAIHGAYWHDTFGKVRSHGCTNVAPADARWLYYWTVLELPQGWHSMIHKRGTYFYFTDDA